jgi:hypothetical protein
MPEFPLIYLILPGAICIYYLVAWLIIGPNLPHGPIVPRYAPPDDMTPAQMRYLITGTTDRKSVAAVLVRLASRKLISIHPENGDYRVTPLLKDAPEGIPGEEAAAMRAVLEVASFANPGATFDAKPGSFLLRPAERQHIALIGSVIGGAVNSKVEKACFSRHLAYSAPAFAVSFVILLAMAGHLENGRNGVFFLTLWLMFCSLIVGLIMAMTVVPTLRDALRGRSNLANVAVSTVPLLMFCAAMGFVDWKIAQGSSAAFAVLIVAVVVLNIGFAISLRRLTPFGRQRLDDVLGFREFLSSVELDRFDRLNDPRLTPALLNDYFAYAIALDLQEAWGDHFSSALFATATSSG